MGDVSAPQLDRDQVVLIHLDARRVEGKPARTDREGFGSGPLILAGGGRDQREKQESNAHA
jgi:hypothetical protein